MVAKRTTRSTKKVKSLKAKGLTAKQVKDVKGGRRGGGNVSAGWNLAQNKPSA